MSWVQGPRYARMRATAIAAGRRRWLRSNYNNGTVYNNGTEAAT
jgi:hypothetical protein